jgi:molybdate transport system substrate-binding protein
MQIRPRRSSAPWIRITRATRRAALALALAVLLLCGGGLAARPAAAEQLQVAVAANFLGTLQKLADSYHRASGNALSLSSGSTGQLYAQIRQGAPFDLFFSADTRRPQLLESQGLGVAGSRFTYAVGTLVLWSPRAGVVDQRGRVLQGGKFRFIAVADAHDAPYGAAAEQVLTKLGLWDRLNRARKIVVGANITQTWQFAASGNADMAFVALSQVIGAGGKISGSYWLPPQSDYQPIAQDALILARSPKRAAAEAFEHWLRSSSAAAQIIGNAGYRTGGA